VVQSLSISRATGGTVFVVTSDQWEALLDAVGGWPEDRRGTAQTSEVIGADAVIQDLAGKRGNSQGFNPDAESRIALEEFSMRRAIAYFQSLGFAVEDVSKTEPYDLHCTRLGQLDLRVEVKGTTGDGRRILLTPNEVEHARENSGNVVLFIASGITEAVLSGEPEASGTYRELVINPWILEEGSLSPIGFSYSVKANA
jgi:hypothetical protein